MRARFDPVVYSALPLPDAVEAWGFEAILAARMADFSARMAAAGLAYDVGALESDPAKILQEADSFREGLVRQRINDAIRATYLASAQRGDLDARAADYHTLRAPGETDDSLRRRAQLAWENLSIGGSYGGYAYQALSVAPADIADVAIWGFEAHEPALFGAKALSDIVKGEVRVAVLGAAQSGAVASSLIARIQAALSRRDIRKVNDQINVVQATLRPYVVDARLTLKRGSAPSAIVAAAKARVAAYAAATRVIGVDATRGGLSAALMQAEPGLVVDVDLYEPAAAVGGGPCEAAVFSGLQLDWRFA